MNLIIPQVAAVESKPAKPGFKDVMMWLLTKIDEKKKEQEVFERCNECKDARKECKTCALELDNVEYDRRSYADMAVRAIAGLPGREIYGKHNDYGHEERYFGSFKSIEQEWESEKRRIEESMLIMEEEQDEYEEYEEEDEEEGEDEDYQGGKLPLQKLKLKKLPVTTLPVRQLPVYKETFEYNLRALAGYKLQLKHVCHVLTKEHELGVAKGWALRTEGGAEDFSKTKYDPVGLMEKIDDAMRVYTALAVDAPNRPKEKPYTMRSKSKKGKHRYPREDEEEEEDEDDYDGLA